MLAALQMPGYVPRFDGKEIGDTFDKHAQMGMDMSVRLFSLGHLTSTASLCAWARYQRNEILQLLLACGTYFSLRCINIGKETDDAEGCWSGTRG